MPEPTPTVVADTATVAETNGAAPAAPARRPPPPRKPRGWRRLIVPAVLLAAAAAYVAVRGVDRAKADALRAFETVKHQVTGPPHHEAPDPSPPPARKWDGLVSVDDKQREALGVTVVAVLPQTKPTQLELAGTTDYDQNTITKVRPLFDARVTYVYKATGQSVKKGEPLVDLYSTQLAEAKSQLREKYVQWEHDKKLLDARRQLALDKQISNVVWVDTQNAELNSHNAYLTALDKLIVYGIGQEEIDKLLAALKNENNPGEVHDIAKLTLLSPIDGVIVDRDVVSGNFYDDMAVLMVVSPMDKLWVWGNVFERDQSEVHLGQACKVQFPYLDETIDGHVEHISTKVDPITRTLKVRATIPNPNRQFKAEMTVKAVLEIPAVPGHTVIPRNALSVLNREHCVFVERSGRPNTFERRKIEVDQERSDTIVVRSGLSPGEKVVTNGSLILSQLYEDETTVATGMPPH